MPEASSGPDQWDQHAQLRDGQRVFIRMLQPADAALYPDFLAEITPEDMRLRFLAPVDELTDNTIAQLTTLDPARAVAFVALDEESQKLLGVARIHYDDGLEGEYAVLVRSGLKGHGLGWLLMQQVIDYARAKGLQQIYGSMLAENSTMLNMCGELGFQIALDPEEPGVRRATLKLR